MNATAREAYVGSCGTRARFNRREPEEFLGWLIKIQAYKYEKHTEVKHKRIGCWQTKMFQLIRRNICTAGKEDNQKRKGFERPVTKFLFSSKKVKVLYFGLKRFPVCAPVPKMFKTQR